MLRAELTSRELPGPTVECREIKGSMTAVLITYLRRTWGERTVERVLAMAGESRTLAALEDAETWGSYAQARSLFEAAVAVTGIADLGRAVGAEVYLHARSDEVLERLRRLGHPSGVVRYVAETSARQSSITQMSCPAAGSRQAIVAAKTLPPFVRHRVFCDYIAGMLSAVPTIFAMDLGHVIEVECQTRGDARCLYLVTWEPTPGAASEAELELLGRRLEDLTTSFEGLEEMATELVSVRDRDAVLAAITERAAVAVQAEQYLLAVRLPRESSTRIHAVGFAVGEAEPYATWLLGDGPLRDSLDSIVVDVASSHHHFGRIAARSPRAGRFLPEETRLLQAYAGHAAAVLEAAAALAEASERAETMSALFALATQLADVTTRADVSRRLAGAMHAVASCDEVTVWTWDVAAGLLRCAGRSQRAARDEPAVYRSEVVAVAGCTPLIAQFVESPDPRTVAPGADDPALARIWSVTSARGGVIMPLVARGECFGLIAIGSRDERAFATPDALGERLRGVAGLASTAFHNARLVDDIRHQALHDALTGLPNRALVLDRLTQSISRATVDEDQVEVLVLDLDGFKEVNDTYGHAAGDELLRLVAERLVGESPALSTVGRLGADEFVVALDGTERAESVEAVAGTLLLALRAPFTLRGAGGMSVTLTTSIGIVSRSNGSAEELLRDADVALHEAKASGRDRAVLFVPAMHAAVRRRLALETDLRTALEEEQFFLLYQPTVHLASGEVTGVEALLRWAHPERGVVAPDDFVPTLEESGLIVAVGRWVLREACRQGATWRALGHDLVVAVNLSARQLEKDALADDVRSALADGGLEPTRLVLELTETALAVNVAETTGRLSELRSLGVRVAVDDFGTGYSSLSYLRQFPVDALKIDRSFVSAITPDGEERALVHTLVQLGKDLGLEVIAEGIEEPFQLERLRAEGCDTGQGYLFARPLDADALVRFVNEQPWSGRPASSTLGA